MTLGVDGNRNVCRVERRSGIGRALRCGGDRAAHDAVEGRFVSNVNDGRDVSTRERRRHNVKYID
jgi:hypothetical protein